MRIFVLLAYLFFPFLAFAQSILINEVAWMGSPVEGVDAKQNWRYEWLELYNPTETSIAVDGWSLELWRETKDFQVALKGTISPQGFFVLGASDKISNFDLNYKNLGGKFFNGGQKVVLKNSLGEVVDEIDARSGWPAGDNKTKQTMERKGVSDTPHAGWQTSVLAGGTPKAPNSSGFMMPEKSTKYLGGSSNISRNSAVQENKKDLPAVATALQAGPSESFQSRVPLVHPLTLVAGLLALGSSGVLLLVKRSLASRQKNQKTST